MLEKLKKNWVYWLIFISHPFIILSLYPHIIFSTPGPDDLMALGASINFDYLNPLIPNDRRLDRLPANLYNFFFYKAFPPIIAHYILYFFSCYLLSYVSYRTFRSILSKKSSIIGTILLVMNVWTFTCFGSPWLTRQMLIYLLLAFLFTYLATYSKSNIRYAGASGFFWGCALFSHFASLPFLFEIPLFFLLVSIFQKNDFRNRLFNYVKLFSLGVCACFVFFGTINRIFYGGPFLSFFNQFIMSRSDMSIYVRDFKFVYSTPTNSLILFAISACVFYLLKNFRVPGPKKTIAIWFLISSTLFSLFYYVGTFFPKSPIFSFVLWLFYYCRWIIPFCSIAIVTTLLPTDINVKPITIFVFYLCNILLITPFALKGLSHFPFIDLLSISTTKLGLWGATIAAAVLFGRHRLSHISGLFLMMMFNTYIFSLSSERIGNGFVDRAYFARLYEGNQFIRDLNAKPPIRTWIGVNNKEYGAWSEYRSFCKLWLSESTFIDGFPKFEPDGQFDSNFFKVKNKIFVIDGNEDGMALQKANETLFQHDRKLVEIKNISLGDRSYGYSIIYCEVTPALSWGNIEKSWFHSSKSTHDPQIIVFNDGLSKWYGLGDCSANNPGIAKFDHEIIDVPTSESVGQKSLVLKSGNHLLCINKSIIGLKPQKLYSIKIRFQLNRIPENNPKSRENPEESYQIEDIYLFQDKYGSIKPLSLEFPQERKIMNGWIEDRRAYLAREPEAKITLYCFSDGTYTQNCMFDSIQIEPISSIPSL